VTAAPLRREASIDVLPAELGDAAAIDRMRHRVRMKRLGRAWLRLDAAPINDDSGASEDDAIDELMPAIGETASRIRVVTEEDGARVAVWIERRDAWDSIVAPVALDGDAAGARSAGAGVWLAAGAPVAVERVRAGAARRTRIVALRDDHVALRGAVPAAFLGHVWIAPHDDRTKTHMAGACPRESSELPPDDREQMSLAEDVVIRAAPSEAAPVLATLLQTLDVAIVARAAGWAEVELRRPYARIRGYVPVSALDPPELPGGFGFGCSGHGFGMSHADRIDVPAGTCLFDRANGDVIGVATETKTRLGTRGRAGDAWSMVYVDTRWSVASLYVRDTGRDPARLVLDACAPDRHRR